MTGFLNTARTEKFTGMLSRLTGAVLAAGAMFCLSSMERLEGLGATGDDRNAERKRARDKFESARDKHRRTPDDADSAMKFGRACFEWAEFAAEKTLRAAIANQGVAACRTAVALAPEFAAGHHYLAMNLGQLAKTRLLGALKLVDEMENELKLAIALDSKFEHSVSERSLGLLYSQAPGWPVSIGNRQSARWHLKNAVRISPDYPENRLCLIEAYLEWGDRAGVQREIKDMKDQLPVMRARFSGDDWKTDWTDWDARWEQLLLASGRRDP